MTNQNKTTSEPVEAGSITNQKSPEFVRVNDIEKMFGIKRGTLYFLLGKGLIKGCLLRVQGSRSGIRLIHLASVRQFINSQLDNEPQSNE